MQDDADLVKISRSDDGRASPQESKKNARPADAERARRGCGLNKGFSDAAHCTLYNIDAAAILPSH
jgi:hypothetical protein